MVYEVFLTFPISIRLESNAAVISLELLHTIALATIFS